MYRKIFKLGSYASNAIVLFFSKTLLKISQMIALRQRERYIFSYLFTKSSSFFSKKQAPLKSPLLTRDFVYDRLYSAADGYFTKDDLQIGEMKQPIVFKDLLGYEEYQRKLAEYYPQNAWLTPSEIFKPYYGMSIANYMH